MFSLRTPAINQTQDVGDQCALPFGVAELLITGIGAIGTGKSHDLQMGENFLSVIAGKDTGEKAFDILLGHGFGFRQQMRRCAHLFRGLVEFQRGKGVHWILLWLNH